METLLDIDRRKPNPKSHAEPAVEAVVTQYAIIYPSHGQVRVSNELRKQGIFVSLSGVRSIWLRHELANFKLRLKALEAKLAADKSLTLTKTQVQSLEKKKLDDEACGEVETVHPGCLSSQDN